MSPKFSKSHVVVVAAAMACALAASGRAAAADEGGSREFDAAGVARIDVQTCDGDVRVRTASGDRIELRWNRQPAPKAELSGSHLEIRTTEDRKCPRDPDRDADLVILAPASIALDLKTVSGNIDIEQRNGEVSTKSVSGDVHLKGIEAEITTKTVSGDVDLAGGHAKRIRAKTVSGDIEATDISGTLELGTVSGDATVKASTLDELEAKTISGGITVRGVTAGEVHVKTLSGDIRWRGEPPKSWNALRSFSGTISVEPEEAK